MGSWELGEGLTPEGFGEDFQSFIHHEFHQGQWQLKRQQEA